MDPTTGIFEQLAVNYGPPGIAIAILLYVIKVQYERNNLLADNLSAMAVKMVEAQSNMTAAVNRLSDGLIRGRGAE